MNNNAIQVFNFEGVELRTVIIDGEPWLCGKDVADRLGYSNNRKAIADHVDTEDRRDDVTFRDAIGREQSMTVINESGFYSLVLGSKLPIAKNYKRWVTSEVLPALRKEGVYKMKAQRKVEDYELKRKRLEIQQLNAESYKREMDIKQAKAIQDMVTNPKFKLSDIACQLFACEAAKVLIGHDIPAALPAAIDANLVSATDLAKRFFHNENKKWLIGKIGREVGLLAPEPEANEFGHWGITRAPTGKEVNAWLYNTAGQKAIERELANRGLLAEDTQISINF